MFKIKHVPWSSYSKPMKALYVASALICVASSGYQMWVAYKADVEVKEYYRNKRLSEGEGTLTDLRYTLNDED